MVTLRKLKKEDAESMHGWMTDSSVTQYLSKSFSEKSIEDCEAFICKSDCDSQNLHLAIADENDKYLGTVSLKNIIGDIAEFAIVVTKEAFGTGASIEAMKEMMHIGFYNIKLSKIIWFVSKENKRALRFYDKNGFHRVPIEHVRATVSSYLTRGGVLYSDHRQLDLVYGRKALKANTLSLSLKM